MVMRVVVGLAERNVFERKLLIFGARQTANEKTKRRKEGEKKGMDTMQATHTRPFNFFSPLTYLDAVRARQRTCHAGQIAQQSPPANGRH